MKKHTLILSFPLLLTILLSTIVTAQNDQFVSLWETANRQSISYEKTNQNYVFLNDYVLNPESQFQPDYEFFDTEPSSQSVVQALKDIKNFPGLKDALNGAYRGVDDIALVDSSYSYDSMNELITIAKNHYSDEGWLELIEIYDRDIFNDQPFDLVVEKTEMNYNEHGNLTHYRYYIYNQEAPSKDDYILYMDYELGWDSAGNQIFHSLKMYNYDTNLLDNISKMERTVDLDHGVVTYYLLQTGHAQYWLNLEKREVELFEDGSIHSSLRKQANQTGEWASGYKQIYESWVNDYYTSITIQNWSVDAQEWKNNERIDYTIKEEGYFESRETYKWDTDTENWWLRQATNFEWEYFVDAYYQVSGVSQTRKEIDDELQLFSRFAYTRDDNGLWTHYLYERYEHQNQEWEYNRQQFQEYEHKLVTYRLVQNWNSNNGNWEDYLQYTYEYDDHGRGTFYLAEMLDLNTGLWRGIQRIYSDYNEHGSILHYNRQSWSIPNETWYSTYMSTNQFNEYNFLTMYEDKWDQNPSNMKWGSGEKAFYDYDEYGFTSHREHHNWDVDEQEFVWQYTYDYLNDYYNNTKKLTHTNPDIEGEEKTYSYVTYQLDVQVMSLGSALEGATFSFMDESWDTNEDGEIVAFLTLTDDMSDEYSIEKEGYNTREGELLLDRNKDMFLFMIPVGLDTYTVTFVIKKGEQTLENVSIELTGYGHDLTDENGEAFFGEVAVQDDILYQLKFEDLNFSDHLSVIDQDVLVELNLVNSITATAGDNGIIDPKGDVELDLGADQVFTITPDEGYLIEDVLVDDVSVGAVSEYTFKNINQDHTIHATFKVDEDEDTFVEGIDGLTFKVYPNPASNYVNVESDVSITELRIIDMNGRVLQAVKSNQSFARLSVNNLNSGLYIIQIHTVYGMTSVNFKKE